MGALMRAMMAVALAGLSGCMGVFYPHPWPLEASGPLPQADGFAPDAPVVVLRQRVRITYVGEGTGVVSPVMTLIDVHETLRIQHASGLDAGTIEIPYPVDALQYLEATARRPDGRVVRVGPDDAVLLRRYEPSGTSGEPTDVTVLLLPEVTVGTTIELRFRASHRLWPWEREVVRPDDLPTLEGTVIVTRPERLALNYLSHGFWRRSGESAGGYAQDIFELSRWTPDSGPRWAGGAPQPQLTISSASVTWPDGRMIGLVAGWGMAGAYLWRDYRNANAHPPRGPQRVSTDDQEALGELSAWVQRNLAPRASLDQQHLRPLSEVVASGYGGKLERALVLYSLLEQRLIPDLSLVVIPPEEEGALTERVATYSSTRWGDFLVRAVIGGQDIYLDPSCVGCAPGELSPRLWRRHTVALRPTGRVEQIKSHGATTRWLYPSVDVIFSRTPEGPSRGARRADLSFALTGEGLRLREGRWRFSGSQAAPLRSRAADSPGAPLDDPHVRRLIDDYAAPSALEPESDGVMALVVRDAPVVRPGIVDTARRVVLPLGALEALPVVDEILTTSISATHDVRLPARVGLSLSLQLSLGPDDRLRSVPGSTRIVSGGAYYTRTASVVGSTLSVTESLMTASQVLPRQGRAAFLGFLAEVRAARRAAIVVDRGAPRP